MIGWSSRLQENCQTISGESLKLMKKNRKIARCKRLDLEALGFQPIMPKNPSKLTRFRFLITVRVEASDFSFSYELHPEKEKRKNWQGCELRLAY